MSPTRTKSKFHPVLGPSPDVKSVLLIPAPLCTVIALPQGPPGEFLRVFLLNLPPSGQDHKAPTLSASLRSPGPQSRALGNALRGRRHTYLVFSARRTLLLIALQSLSCVQLFVTPWTTACQAPLSMGFPRQESWSRLPFPSPGDLPNPRIVS